MKFLDSSFNSTWDPNLSLPQAGIWEPPSQPTPSLSHKPRYWEVPPKYQPKYLPMVERFEVEDQIQNQNEMCHHVESCAYCKHLIDAKIRSHWAHKLSELKNDVLEFLGLICFGIFIIILVDLLLNYKS